MKPLVETILTSSSGGAVAAGRQDPFLVNQLLHPAVTRLDMTSLSWVYRTHLLTNIKKMTRLFSVKLALSQGYNVLSLGTLNTQMVLKTWFFLSNYH